VIGPLIVVDRQRSCSKARRLVLGRQSSIFQTPWFRMEFSAYKRGNSVRTLFNRVSQIVLLGLSTCYSENLWMARIPETFVPKSKFSPSRKPGSALSSPNLSPPASDSRPPLAVEPIKDPRSNFEVFKFKTRKVVVSLFPTLRFNMIPNRLFVPTLPNCVYVISFRPKLPPPHSCFFTSGTRRNISRDVILLSV